MNNTGNYVPITYGCIITTGHDHVGHGPRHERTTAHIIGMTHERRCAALAWEIPKPDSFIITRTHETRQVGRGELGRPNGLLVLGPRLQDGARVHVKDLYLALVITCDHDSAVTSHISASGNVAKPRDGLDQLSRSDGIQLHSSACGDGEQVTIGGRGIAQVGGGGRDMGDRVLRGRGNVQLVLESFPVSLLGSEGQRARGQLELR